MKKVSLRLVIAFILLSGFSAVAQTFDLYGMTNQGGKYGLGTIFKCSPSGNLTVLVNFNDTNGSYPCGSLIQGSDGNLYGMTTQWHPYVSTEQYGTIFKCTLSGVLTTIFKFNDTNGAYPYGSLIQATDGNLYGMTSAGSTYGDGTIFKCTTSGILTTLVVLEIDKYMGVAPYGNLIQANDGNLYGMTSFGGFFTKCPANSGYGTVFKCTLSGNYTTLAIFNGDNGSDPYGSLIQGTDGNLYGMTSGEDANGGDYNVPYGTIFKISTSGNLTVMDKFNEPYPFGNLIQGAHGDFYGMMSRDGVSGNGMIFKFDTSSVLTTLASFDTVNGISPFGSLMQASDGNMYGMTSSGGAFGKGTIFKYDSSGSLTTLFSFNYTNGEAPQYGTLLEATPSMTEHLPSSDNISLYPNPSSQMVYLSFQLQNTMNTSIDVIDVAGKELSKINTVVNNGNTVPINIGNLAEGLYFVRIISDKETKVIKFIKE